MALDERLQLDAALHERQIEQGPAIGRRWFASATCGRACRVLFGGPFPMPRCHGLSTYTNCSCRFWVLRS